MCFLFCREIFSRDAGVVRQAFLLLLVSLFRRRIGNVGVVCHLTVGTLDDVSILIRFRCLGLGDSSGLRLLPGCLLYTYPSPRDEQ